MSGVPEREIKELPANTSEWPLHLKHTTPLDVDAVLALPTHRAGTGTLLRQSLRYLLEPRMYEHLRTSRTLKPARLSPEDLARMVEMGKVEPAPISEVHGAALPEGVHGVNVFTVTETKGRRRLITEPLLNRVVSKKTLPRVTYDTRLRRRQQLRDAKYMLQIDFEAYYDAIPLPETLRNLFVFHVHAGAAAATTTAGGGGGGSGRRCYYRLRTLPTGARWSVAVGQSVTNAIVDIDTPVTVLTMIDNILIAAAPGQEHEFLRAVREVLLRIRRVNLLTSPDREHLLGLPDSEILSMACEENTFLGEVFQWNGTERVVRNSVKTMAKLKLALAKPAYTCRSFASIVSLISFALHTTLLNPAKIFTLLRAYRAVYRMVHHGFDWDDPLPYLDTKVLQSLHDVGRRLLDNDWWQIAAERQPTYNDEAYDYICYTDASLAGWGAFISHVRTGEMLALQQRWTTDLAPAPRITTTALATIPQQQRTSRRSCGLPPHREPEHGGEECDDARLVFMARHSAHAEPRAARHTLEYLVASLGIPEGSKIALVTDHYAIVHAQRQLNGFGGIGRGLALNTLYEYTHDLWTRKKIEVTFFYVQGPLNPADTLSRNFGDSSSAAAVDNPSLLVHRVHDVALPPLRSTACPLCEVVDEHEDPETTAWSPELEAYYGGPMA